MGARCCWVSKIRHCTHTHETRDPKPAGFPTPMTNLMWAGLVLVHSRGRAHLHCPPLFTFSLTMMRCPCSNIVMSPGYSHPKHYNVVGSTHPRGVVMSEIIIKGGFSGCLTDGDGSRTFGIIK